MPAEIASGIERVTVKTVTEAAADREAGGEASILSELDRQPQIRCALHQHAQSDSALETRQRCSEAMMDP